MTRTTAPTRRVNRGTGHSYYLDAGPVDGVTTILNRGLPKPALVKWAARTVAEWCADHPRTDADGRDEWTDRAKTAPDRDRDRAARRGTEVHALAERLAAGDEVDVPDELSGHVDSYLAFVRDFAPETVALETPVFSRAHHYAGTLDSIVDCPALGDGRTLLDIKTGRSGIFGDTALQLAAYRYADFAVVDGVEVPLVDFDVRRTAVLWLSADRYELRLLDTSPAVFDLFLYVQQVAHVAKDWNVLLGHPVPAPDPGRLARLELVGDPVA